MESARGEILLILHIKKMKKFQFESKLIISRKPIPVGIFTCDICGQQRISRLAIYDHIRRTHVNDPSPCHICGKVFRHPSLLKTHMKYHTTPMHTCLMCPDKAYATAQALRRHQESNHGLGPGYPCDYCPAIYK